MRFCTDFAANFKVEEAPELPGKAGSPQVYYYPGASLSGGNDGILLRIWPEGAEPWMGLFAQGHVCSSAPTVVTTCPDPDELCVVAAGAGYIVRASDPLKWQELPCAPILQIFSIPQQRLLLFADYVKLVGYSTLGIKWISQRLSIDDLKIVGLRDNRLEVSAEVPSTVGFSRVSKFVDLETGRELF